MSQNDIVDLSKILSYRCYKCGSIKTKGSLTACNYCRIDLCSSCVAHIKSIGTASDKILCKIFHQQSKL